ncbi:MAG TPA: ISAs1 family transposase, partial [Chitinophagaceae bacterium]|nr:ISAs1 family transposase [Chitinophagaceae bacterium]
YLALVTLCGFLCGCNTIEEIAEYAILQAEWFTSLLPDSGRIPSYGALWWFLVKTPPEALKGYLQKWFVKLPHQLRDKLLALDGKRLRSANFLGRITHLVELFAADDRLCLCVEKVDDKAVEKSTLPALLNQVDVQGAIISADAHFTLAEVAEQIVDAKADYFLAVKGNQPTLCSELENFFDQAHAIDWEEVDHTSYKSVDKDHGRIETQEVRVVTNFDWLPEKLKWKGLKALIEIRTTREKTNTGKSESSRRIYISSRLAKAEQFAQWSKQHWSIENNCHWVADVIFQEDFALADRGHSAENLGLFRRLAMNMAAIGDPGRGMASVRRAAAFGAGYLKGILARIFCSEVLKNFS